MDKVVIKNTMDKVVIKNTMDKIVIENTIITWRLDVACKALTEALQDDEAVQRYLKMKNLEQHEVHLKDLGWVRKVS